MKTYTYKGETHTLKGWCDILRASGDDLKEFVEELEFDGRLSNAALYELYVIWRGDNPMPKVQFEKWVAKAIKKYRPDLKPFKSGNVRGYCPNRPIFS